LLTPARHRAAAGLRHDRNMIVRSRPNAAQLLYIMRGSVVPRIFPRILTITVLAAGVVWLHRLYPIYFPDYSAAPFTLLGLALSIFLGFRNDACFERWWEARRQWGQLIVELRSFGREVAALMPGTDPETVTLRRRMLRRGIAYPYALAESLRGVAHDAELDRYLEAEAPPISSACCCPSGWWTISASRRLWPRPSSPTPSSASTNWATSWRSRSGSPRTTCP
jgi:predicted membrane chloride channel (bestrophin family)